MEKKLENMTVPSLSGNGINIVKILNKLPFQFHLPGHNYTGPGTNVHRNIALGVKPINKVDEAAMRHDIAYHEALKNGLPQKEADLKFLSETKDIYNDSNNTLRERGEAFLVNKIIGLKNYLGMGIEEKFLKYLQDNKSIIEHTSSKKSEISEDNLIFLRAISDEYNFKVK